MRLSRLHQRLLQVMAGHGFLKAHRDLEGHKVYLLHPLEGGEEVIPAVAVSYLVDHGLIDSNKKFPAATFWLTKLGEETVKKTSRETGD
jgi:hypothetical protein